MPYEQGLYMRMGRFVRILNPGINFVTPLVNTVVRMDMRTQVLDIPSQGIVSEDKSVMNVDAVMYIKVVDPLKAFFQVTNYRTAAVYLAQTTLSALVGGMNHDQAVLSRRELGIRLTRELDHAANEWGVKVERVEVRKVDVIGNVTESLARSVALDEVQPQLDYRKMTKGYAYKTERGPRKIAEPRSR
jgi:regulator of protease activity HflC (stomatin/prohibitin superfamily)